jgi:hypothetical protein
MADLRALVAQRYDRLGLPSWPDPHPEMTAPRDEEYSRVTAPERYAVAYARARVWTDMEWGRRLADGDRVRLPRGTEAFVGRPWFD